GDIPVGDPRARPLDRNRLGPADHGHIRRRHHSPGFRGAEAVLRLSGGLRPAHGALLPVHLLLCVAWLPRGLRDRGSPLMRTTLVGGRALTPNGFEADLCVTVEGERIVAVGGPPEGEIVDLGGSLLVPGFVDLQVNGGGDVLLNDSPDAATMARIADAHLCFGT